MAERFIASPYPHFGDSTPPKLITYPETCAWYGSLTFAKLAGEKALTKSLLRRFDPLFGPTRPRIVTGDRKMMTSLLGFQTADGMWRQLVDDPESWPESSCTGMFTFAMITGVKNVWLDAETYGPAARKGWLALTGYLNPDGDIREVCIGTNKKKDRQYYLDRKRLVGDMHGQAPVLWCASALLR